MTTALDLGTVPAWDQSDRMRKALRTADVSVNEMADYLGVSRNTVGTWINGRIDPSKQTLRLWALRTGVPLMWLETGMAPAEPGPEDPLCAIRDSNPEPADLAQFRRRVVDRNTARPLPITPCEPAYAQTGCPTRRSA